MSEIKTGARAVADLVDGCIVACVELATSPERVFLALASPEIIDWWVNPGVFDTREWTADVRVGGQWRASGIARGPMRLRENSSKSTRHEDWYKRGIWSGRRARRRG